MECKHEEKIMVINSNGIEVDDYFFCGMCNRNVDYEV